MGLRRDFVDAMKYAMELVFNGRSVLFTEDEDYQYIYNSVTGEFLSNGCKRQKTELTKEEEILEPLIHIHVISSISSSDSSLGWIRIYKKWCLIAFVLFSQLPTDKFRFLFMDSAREMQLVSVPSFSLVTSLCCTGAGQM